MFACSFIFIVGSLACLGAAHPIDTDVASQWLVRARSPMAEQPSGGGYQYAMPAYVTGGTVVASTLQCADCSKSADEQPEATQPEDEPMSTKEPKSAEEPATHEQEVPAQVEDDNMGVTVPSHKPKIVKGRSIDDKEKDTADDDKEKDTADDDEEDDDDDDDDEDDDDDDDDDSGARKGGSTYTNFFPMSFGAKLRVARDASAYGGDEDVIAISNSFGSGPGAVASSAAKAYARASAASGQHTPLDAAPRSESEEPSSEDNEPL